MRHSNKTLAVLFAAVVLAAAAFQPTGNSMKEDESMQQAAEIQAGHVPPIDREVPQHLETAVFGLG